MAIMQNLLPIVFRESINNMSDQLKVGDPKPEGFDLANCGCVYHAEENILCPHDIEKLNFRHMEMMEDFRDEFINSDLPWDEEDE